MSVAERTYALWVAGSARRSDSSYSVVSPYSGEVVAEVGLAGAEDVEQAVSSARSSFPEIADLPAHVRAAALSEIAGGIRDEAESFAQLITTESGKPIRWARVEVARSAANYQRAAEEAKRFAGELVRLDEDPVGDGRVGLVRRFPVGPVLGITPFNFPMNLVSHKLAPAIAVGAPMILKPAPQTPLSALRLAELVARTDLPDASLSVLPLPHGELLDNLVRDPRVPIVSYTGSQVGWDIKASVPRKRVLLELGGNGAAIVEPDADVARAANAIALGAYIYAGQTCISTQRVYVHRSIAKPFTDALVEAARQLRMGDPFDPETMVGPLVSDAAATRVLELIEEAQQSGATLLCGGARDGNAIAPAVLSGGDRGSRIWSDEAFGPVLAIDSYQDLDEAFGRVNDSRYGLQAGIFTTDIQTAFRAHRDLDVGTVIVGDSPSYRSDPLPYGGGKDSGVGREGVRAAMQELSEPRALILPER
jgi:aldehyde dehydrogenase (NAD+)/glyceraldehyde-3-phosphate dehydrogenase (NADP+)